MKKCDLKTIIKFVIKEVSQKDIQSTIPKSGDIWNKDWSPKLKKMTLGNLKSVKEKAARFIESLQSCGDDGLEKIDKYVKLWKICDKEIRKRLQYINKPVSEDHGLGFSHNVSIPGDENTMNKSTIGRLK